MCVSHQGCAGVEKQDFLTKMTKCNSVADCKEIVKAACTEKKKNNKWLKCNRECDAEDPKIMKLVQKEKKL